MIRIIYLPLVVVGMMSLASCVPNSEPQRLETESPQGTTEMNPSGDSLGESAPRNEIIELHEPLRMPHAVSLALIHNPDLKAYSWELRAADARQAQARLLPNPELALGIEEFGGDGLRQGFDGMEATIAFTQPIETGGKRKHRSRVASLEMEVVQREFEQARLDVVRETRHAYLELFRLQRQADLAERQTEVAAQLTQAVRRRVDVGKDTPSEVAKAQIELSQAQLAYKRILSEMADARSTLELLWGMTSVKFETVDTDLESSHSLPPLDQLKQQAQEHPQILRWEYQQELSRARLYLAKADSHSDLAVTAGIKRLELEDDNTGVLGLAVPLPLFNRNQGTIAAAQHDMAKNQERRVQAAAAVQSRLTRSYRQLEMALAHQAILENTVLVNAKLVFEAARTGYEEGKTDYLKLLDAQRTLFQTEVQLFKAEAAVHLGWAELEYAVGYTTY
jgi:cobalt-zinc-cadmium efflux system outer membrane protein